MIDFHAHLGKVIHGQPALTVDDLLHFMDSHGIEISVVLPLVSPEEEDYYYTTEQALEDCAKCPDRLIPFACMDPRRGTNDGKYDFYPVLEEYADRGCRGFGDGREEKCMRLPSTIQRRPYYPSRIVDAVCIPEGQSGRRINHTIQIGHCPV